MELRKIVVTEAAPRCNRRGGSFTGYRVDVGISEPMPARYQVMRVPILVLLRG